MAHLTGKSERLAQCGLVLFLPHLCFIVLSGRTAVHCTLHNIVRVACRLLLEISGERFKNWSEAELGGGGELGYC